MLNNMDYSNQALREDMKYWGYWVVRELGLSGFRLDATNHVSQRFTNEWMDHVDAAIGQRLFYVGEFWSGDVKLLVNWLTHSPPKYHLFDVPLFYSMAKMSLSDTPDLRLIFNNTLVHAKPYNAVTFVMNHDTQYVQPIFCP